ncbi:MAG: hypothetical protein ACREQA_15350 [Candidatus Binatia bacterium]
MMMKVLLLIALLLGIATALWSNAGDASVLAATGGIYTVLQRYAPELVKNPKVLGEVYDTILVLQRPWIVVFWLGCLTSLTALVGLVVLLRGGRK